MTVPTMPSAGEVEADHQRRAAKQQQWETERVQAIQDEQMAQVHERNLRFGLEDLDTLEADFTARLEQLRERAQRLAPEALKGGLEATQLTEVEAEITQLETQLARIPLARTEARRREEEAARIAATRRPFLVEGAKLSQERAKAAKAVDRAAVAYARALRRWDLLTTDQERVLGRAGRDPRTVRPRSWMIEAGLMRALLDAGLPHGIIRLEFQAGAQATVRPGKIAPLAKYDAPLGAVEVPADESDKPKGRSR